MPTNHATFKKDPINKTITVVRPFAAPLADVWNAWTNSAILDIWWAPKPYRAETKSMDFKEGGHWLYAMVGPEGDKQWCRADYGTIKNEESVKWTDMFCDEEGNMNKELPRMNWTLNFKESAGETVVTIDLTFNEPKDMQTILEMGFEEGFASGMNNLDDYFAAKV